MKRRILRSPASNSLLASTVALTLTLISSGAVNAISSDSESDSGQSEKTQTSSSPSKSTPKDFTVSEKKKKSRALFKDAVALYQENKVDDSYSKLEKIDKLFGRNCNERIKKKLLEAAKKKSFYAVYPEHAELLGEFAAFIYDEEYSPELVGRLETVLAGKLFDIWQNIPDKEPDHVIILTIKALCQDALKNFQSVGDQKLIAAAYCRVGDVASNQGLYADAEKYFKKALEAGLPEVHTLDAYVLLLEALIIQDKYDEYKAMVDKFQKKYGDKYPDFAKSQLAYYYFRVGKFDQAENTLKSTSSKDGIHASIVENNLAKVCIEKGKFDQARQHLANSRKMLSKQSGLTSKFNRSFLLRMERKLAEHKRKYSANALLGFSTRALDNENRASLGYDTSDFGVIVRSVFPESEAEKGGFLIGDLIQAVDNNVISTPSALHSYLESLDHKRNLAFSIKRKTKSKKLKISFEPKYTQRADSKKTGKNFEDSKNQIIALYKEYIKASAAGDDKALDKLVYGSYFAGDPDSNKYTDIRQSLELKSKYPNQTLKTIIVDIKGKGQEAVIRSIDLYEASERLRLDGKENSAVLKAYLLADNYFKNINGEWKLVAIKNLDSLSTVAYGQTYGAYLDLAVSPGVIESGKDYTARLEIRDIVPKNIIKRIAFYRKDSDPQSRTDFNFRELTPTDIEETFTSNDTNNTESLIATVKYFGDKNEPTGLIQINKLIPTSKRDETFAAKARFAFTSKQVLQSVLNKTKKKKSKKNQVESPAGTSPVIEALEAMAQKDDTASQLALAEYLAGRKSHKKAYLQYLKAAEKGSLEAQRSIYVLSLASEDISREDGLKWIKKAIASDDPEAMLLYAEEFYYSKERTALLEKASKLGSAKAKAELGYMYINGVGVKRDAKKGLTYLQSAVKTNYAPAEYQMGMYHLKNAIDWLYRASTHGYSEANDYLTKMKKSGMVR